MSNNTIRQFVINSLNGFYQRLKTKFESSSNKVNTITGNENNTDKYPSTKAVADAVINKGVWKQGSYGQGSAVLYEGQDNIDAAASGAAAIGYTENLSGQGSQDALVSAEELGSFAHGRIKILSRDGEYQLADNAAIMASGQGSYAGGYVYVSKSDADLNGYAQIYASGLGAHAEGAAIADYDQNILSYSSASMIEASGIGSHAEGIGTTSSGNGSHAEGVSTEASSDGGHAEGRETTTTGDSSHAEGMRTTASGDYSHSEGQSTRASETCAHAEGSNSRAEGLYSHAEGNICYALGDSSHAEGYYTVSLGNSSHAEGGGHPHISTGIKITGDASAVNYTANGSLSAAGIGVGSLISYAGTTRKVVSVTSDTSFTVNATFSTRAISNGSCYLESGAGGDYSHTEGLHTTASEQASHAEGLQTYAKNPSEHAQGQYNVSNKTNTTFGNAGNTIHSVGIGTSSSTRKNAFEVMQNGDVYIYGIGGYDGTNANTTGVYTLQGMLDGIETLLAAI